MFLFGAVSCSYSFYLFFSFSKSQPAACTAKCLFVQRLTFQQPGTFCKLMPDGGQHSETITTPEYRVVLLLLFVCAVEKSFRDMYRRSGGHGWERRDVEAVLSESA